MAGLFEFLYLGEYFLFIYFFSQVYGSTSLYILELKLKEREEGIESGRKEDWE